jgi:carboxymethylenebutenolidase
MCRLVPVVVDDTLISASVPPADPTVHGSWQVLPPLRLPQVPLRAWLASPAKDTLPRGGVLVLPEVFGINGWVRSVANRLAAQGYVALAVPLFARTAPDLELGYDQDSLVEGRAHKEHTSTAELLLDLGQAADWLRGWLGTPGAPLGCVGFCFGGHGALLAATLPQIGATCDFYGAGVASGRPGGGPPSLELVPEIPGRLLCFCGDQDELIPEADVLAIERALRGSRHRLIRVPQAGHGFMCEAREAFRAPAAELGWQQMLALFAAELDPDPSMGP